MADQPPDPSDSTGIDFSDASELDMVCLSPDTGPKIVIMPKQPDPKTKPSESASAQAGSEMVMPGEPSTPASGSSSSAPDKPAPFGLQMAQLVIIPALIVIACISLAWMFSVLASAKDDIDTHLLKLRQSSGAGKLAMGLQDPRYKDRGLAAYNIATMIRHETDPKEKLRISTALSEILEQHVAKDEYVLQDYLLRALGQLGQPGGLDTIMKRLDAPHPRIRQGAIGGVLSWPDAHEARRGLGALTARLTDDDPIVRAIAAAAVGQIATPQDEHVIESLRSSMQNADGLEMREARWNAAVALAKLGDTQGGRFVADVLLDRSVLAEMPAGETGPSVEQKMTRGMADRVMLSTLASVYQTNDPRIWRRVSQIADNDPSRVVKTAAQKLLRSRSSQRPKTDNEPD